MNSILNNDEESCAIMNVKFICIIYTGLYIKKIVVKKKKLLDEAMWVRSKTKKKRDEGKGTTSALMAGATPARVSYPKIIPTVV